MLTLYMQLVAQDSGNGQAVVTEGDAVIGADNIVGTTRCFCRHIKSSKVCSLDWSKRFSFSAR